MRRYREGIDELDKAVKHLENGVNAITRFENLCSHPDHGIKMDIARVMRALSRKREEAVVSAEMQEAAVYGTGVLRPTFISGSRSVNLVVKRPGPQKPNPYIEDAGMEALRVMLGDEEIRVNAPYDVDVYSRGRRASVIKGIKFREGE